jgi:nucleotide-binding universal stress UspA family protein
MATVLAEGVDQRIGDTVSQKREEPEGREECLGQRQPADRSFRVVAVPLDGSQHARAALDPAVALARRLGAEIVLVRVAAAVRVPGIDLDLAERLGETDAFVDLCAEVRRLRAKGVAAREVTISGGDLSPADGILAAVRETGADLLVMATHGRRGVARAVLGSVAAEVARRAPVPVLLTRPDVPGCDRQDRQATGGALRAAGSPADALRLLVAVDGSPESEASLPTVACLAVALDARVGLVRVIPAGGSIFGAEDGVQAQEVAVRRVQQAALALQHLGVPSASLRSAVRAGKVASALLDQAARQGADLLVMAPHPRGPLALGSATAAVVARAQVPVLVIHALSG